LLFIINPINHFYKKINIDTLNKNLLMMNISSKNIEFIHKAFIDESNLTSKIKDSALQSSQEVKYPEFGQAVGDPYRLSLKQKALKITKIGLIGISIAASGAIFGLPGIAVGLAIVIIYQVAKKIFTTYYDYRYRLAFEPGPNNSNASKLGEYTKVDLRVSNHVTESFEWKKTLISSSQHSIELSANFAGGEQFREVLQLIERQMTKYPDLKCHLILSSDLLEQQDRKYLANLKETYPHFNCLITDRIYTTTPEILSEENHVKMLIVDGQYFVMGGTGIHEKMTREENPGTASDQDESYGAKFIDKTFRDTDIIGYGETAQTMRNQFFNLYHIWEHRMTGSGANHYFVTDPTKTGRCELFHEEEGLIKESSLKYIVCGPEHRQKNPISSEIAELAREAKKDIKIANLYFNPGVSISDALIEAKNKGVSVQGYFNGTEKPSSSHYLYALPNRHNYTLVTEVFEYQKRDQLYHKKVMTVDSRYTVIGSFNFGVKSAKCDYENVCVIDDSRVTDLMNNALREDTAESKQLSGSSLLSKKRWNQLPSLLAIGLLGNLCG
jgi:hypothetical protein